MRVHLIKKLTIQDYCEVNARIKSSFSHWLEVIKDADWEKPKDIQKTFGSADLLGNSSSRIVFNIGGNNCRMICKYAFGENNVHLFICWIGTHAEYDRLCDGNDQYEVNIY